jgi:hypothetical protein
LHAAVEAAAREAIRANVMGTCATLLGMATLIAAALWHR